MEGLTELLVLDGLDILLEFSLENRFSDLVCFLAEADRFRLPDSNAMTPQRQDRIISLLEKIEHELYDAYPPTSMQNLKSVLSLRIPFPTIFARVCDVVYAKIEGHVRKLPIATLAKKVIPKLDELKPELSSVLKSPISHKYYEMFLTANRPIDLGSLQCWEEVSALLQSIQEYILPTPGHPSATHPSATNTNYSNPNPNAEKRHSVAASKGAMDALLMGSGGTAAAASASYLLGETLSDSLRVFSLLLVAMRQLQRRFFAPGAPGLLGAAPATDRQLLGISDALRMELATTLNMTSSVRGNDVESVDSAFAAACAGRMVRLLRFVERETFQHLQLQFPAFVQSPEYFLSLAAFRASASPAVEQYSSLCKFLTQRVARESVVNWTDPEAFGKTFVFVEIGLKDEVVTCTGGDNLDEPPGLLLRGPYCTTLSSPNTSPNTSCPPALCKMWTLAKTPTSTPKLKPANPFSLNQESLRKLVSDVWIEVQHHLPIAGIRKGKISEISDDAEICLSFLLSLSSPLARALCVLMPGIGEEGMQSFVSSPTQYYLALAVSKLQVGQIGIACALCRPPATPLLQGLRLSSMWALKPDGDCLKFDISMAQWAVKQELGPRGLVDIYGLGDTHAHLIQFGECDFSIREVIDSLGVRTLLQILLLLLTNRSILLIGRSISRLSRILAVLPRLAWPFSLDASHQLAGHFSTPQAFEDWVRASLNAHSGEKDEDKDKDKGKGAMTKAWLASASIVTFDSTSAETRRIITAMQGAGSAAGSSHTGLFAFNVDTCDLISFAREPKTNASSVLRNSQIGFSMLTNPVLLNRLNSGAFRRLHSQIRQASDNAMCERAFLQYFVDIFLRYLPPTINHYPKFNVIACDVRKFLSDLPRPNSTGAGDGRTGLPGGQSEIEVEFATELVGLTSPVFLQLLNEHKSLIFI